MKYETTRKRLLVNSAEKRDTKKVQVELPIDLYNFLLDYYLLQSKTLDQVIAREMMDLARRILEDGPSPAWFDAESVARKYNLSCLLHSTPESPTSESGLKPSGGE